MTQCLQLLIDRDPVPVCDWEAWMNQFALKPSSIRDEDTVLVVNNLPCMNEGAVKDKRQTKNIAVQVVSKTGLIIKGLSIESPKQIMTKCVSDSDNFVVTNNCICNVCRNLFFFNSSI